MGAEEDGWSASVIGGRVAGDVYELTVHLTRGNESVRKVFQVGFPMLRLLPRRQLKNRERVEFRDIDPRLGRVALGHLRGEAASFSWTICMRSAPTNFMLWSVAVVSWAAV